MHVMIRYFFEPKVKYFAANIAEGNYRAANIAEGKYHEVTIAQLLSP
jgi:hypothetical protein